MSKSGLTIEFATEDFGEFADDLDMKQGLQSFALELDYRGLTPKTQKGYRDRLRYFRRYLTRVAHIKFADITSDTIKEYVVYLKRKNLSEISINGYLKVLSVYWNYLCSVGLWNGSPNPMTAIKLLRVPQIEKRVLKLEDVKRILAVPSRKNFFGFRTYVMLLLFYDTAIRLNELRAITLEDIDIQGGTILIHGKGRKQRIAIFGKRTAKWLHLFITRWRLQYPGEYLFSTRKGKQILESTVQRTVRRVGEKAGLEIPLSPHLIRHSAATHRAQAGMPTFWLQRYLGHASVRTTERYVHMADSEDEREKFRRFSPLDSLR